MADDETLSQRDMMRKLVQQWGLDRETVCAAYAKAELDGRVARTRNSQGLSAEDYAYRLWADGEAKGWLSRREP